MVVFSFYVLVCYVYCSLLPLIPIILHHYLCPHCLLLLLSYYLSYFWFFFFFFIFIFLVFIFLLFCFILLITYVFFHISSFPLSFFWFISSNCSGCCIFSYSSSLSSFVSSGPPCPPKPLKRKRMERTLISFCLPICFFAKASLCGFVLST